MNTKKNLRAVMLMLFLCACQRTPEASSRPEDLSFSSLSSFRSSVSSTQSIQSSSSSLSSVSSSISSSSSVQSSAASSGSSSSAASSGISSQPEAPVSSAPSSEAVSDTGSDASSAPLPVYDPNTNPDTSGKVSQEPETYDPNQPNMWKFWDYLSAHLSKNDYAYIQLGDEPENQLEIGAVNQENVAKVIEAYERENAPCQYQLIPETYSMQQLDDAQEFLLAHQEEIYGKFMFNMIGPMPGKNLLVCEVEPKAVPALEAFLKEHGLTDMVVIESTEEINTLV